MPTLGSLIAVLFLAGSFPGVSQARVFSMNSEKFGSFLGGSYGTTAIKNQALVYESSADSYSSSVSSLNSGEFGFVYRTGIVGWRFSFEFLQPGSLSSVNASSGSSVLYQVNSTLSAYAPKLGLEISFKGSEKMRWLMFVYGGSASATLKNEYTGVSISPSADHTVEAKASGTLIGGGFAGEIHFVDTTTFFMELGYRSLVLSNFAYSKDVTTFTGAQTTGSPILNTLSEKRKVDFSGVFVTAGFRFWLF